MMSKLLQCLEREWDLSEREHLFGNLRKEWGLNGRAGGLALLLLQVYWKERCLNGRAGRLVNLRKECRLNWRGSGLGNLRKEWGLNGRAGGLALLLPQVAQVDWKVRAVPFFCFECAWVCTTSHHTIHDYQTNVPVRRRLPFSFLLCSCPCFVLPYTRTIF